MVAGFHLIWTAYGWWLPNDPRGSMSHEIREAKIAELGELHLGRKRIQPSSAEIRRFYEAARTVLKHPLLTMGTAEVAVIAESFATVMRERKYTCYACAIMSDHVHVLIRKHRDLAEDMIKALQQHSRALLLERDLRPPEHPVWGGPGWRVYLETQRDFEKVANYIWNNPLKIGRPAQIWPFVTKYDGWMPGKPPRRYSR